MKSITFIRMFWVFLGSSILMAATVHADDDPVGAGDAEDRARIAFLRATELFAAEQYEAAADAFRQAYEAKPSWKIQYNIAQAESAAKRFGLALRAFELFLADGGDEIAMERRDEVLLEIRRLREMVASLDVQGPAGAEVFVDGLNRGVLPLEGLIKITAGKRHDVKVVLDGAVLENRTIRMSGGDATVLKVQSVNTVSEAPPQSAVADTAGADLEGAVIPAKDATDDGLAKGKREITEENSSKNSGNENVERPDGKSLRVAGVVLMGTGGAAGVLGGVLGGLALSKAGDVKSLCDNDDNTCNTAEGAAAYDDATSYGTLANVLIPVGVAIAGTGLILVLVGKKQKERLSAVSVVPVASSETGGIVLSGRF